MKTFVFILGVGILLEGRHYLLVYLDSSTKPKHFFHETARENFFSGNLDFSQMFFAFRDHSFFLRSFVYLYFFYSTNQSRLEYENYSTVAAVQKLNSIKVWIKNILLFLYFTVLRTCNYHSTNNCEMQMFPIIFPTQVKNKFNDARCLFFLFDVLPVYLVHTPIFRCSFCCLFWFLLEFLFHYLTVSVYLTYKS